MKHITAILFILIFFADVIRGQLEPVAPFYDGHTPAINAASARNEFLFDEYTTFLSASYRQQWVDFENPPRTLKVNYSTWLSDIFSKKKIVNRLHLDFSLVMDEIPPRRTYESYMRLSYRMPLFTNNKKWMTFLSAGFSGGIMSHSIGINELNLIDEFDPYFMELRNTTTKGNFGGGIMLSHYLSREGYTLRESREGFYVGISIPHVLDFNFKSPDGSIPFSKKRQLYGVIGGQFGNYLDKNLKFRPNLTFVPGSYFDFMFEIQPKVERFWLGVGFRIDEALDKNQAITFKMSVAPYLKKNRIELISSVTRNLSNPLNTFFNNSYEFTVVLMFDNDEDNDHPGNRR